MKHLETPKNREVSQLADEELAEAEKLSREECEEHLKQLDEQNEDKPYYTMMDTIRSQGEIFWRFEIYKEYEFEEAGLKLSDLLEKGLCQLFEKDESEEDEDSELSLRYGDRGELLESEWEERPEGLTVGKWFRQKRSES
ncbi:hypothetical protein AAGG74_15690 [Bacillus mexicanus]|uniref:hypothetical protein n=1 Tax=Bacillus mexicanus TaxID=2834415 RepID=UPI003D209041